MRSLISLSLVFLAAILPGVALAASTPKSCYDEMCLDGNSPVTKRQATSTTPMIRKDLTNAERLARGLPLNPPTRRTHSGIAARQAQTSATPPVTYTKVIQVFSGTTSLGYIAPDPNYWTPLLTPDISSALQVSFSLPSGVTTGAQVDFTQLNDNRGTLFGPVVGRDSTSSAIATGDFNYLYLDPVASPGSTPGATPQSIPSFFATSSGLDKQAETSIWNVDVVAGTLTGQWINPDSSSPTTVFFVQSNHVYAGGDADAFHSRFPAPVTTVTLALVDV